jgi:hypothetical protein
MMTRSKTAFAAGAGGLLLGLGLAAFSGAWRAEPRPVPSAAHKDERPASQGSAPLVASLSETDKLRLQALVREELRALPALQAVPSGTAPEADAPGKPASAIEDMNEEQISAYEQGRTIVDAALAKGTWTDSDRDDLHRRIATLPGELRVELARPLVAAINREQVRFEGDGPPF